MNFNYLSYLPLIIVVLSVLSYLLVKHEKSYFKWIESYFFLKRTSTSKAAQVAYIVAFIFLGLSLLDLRGKEEKIKADIPDQKTIIIIDSSASMLVEDVRPNRYKKALLMARHFVKKAVGHQVAVVLFSDSQKRLVPFTDDIDLLDARIAGLEKLSITEGGSNLTQAIKESLQYFKAESGTVENVSGNILIFTDSEEHSSSFEVEVPNSVSVAAVGVGTLKGGPIPIRNREGVFKGYKKFNGEKVISKLNENLLKGLATKIKNYKYWVALSYTIPTEEILSFFRKIHKNKTEKGDIRIKPVLAKYLMIPFVLFYVLAVFLRTRKSLYLPSVLALLLMGTNVEVSYAVEEKESPLINNINQAMEKLKNNTLSHRGVLTLAGNLLAVKKYEQSLNLFEENLKEWDDERVEDLFNYGTSLLANKKVDEGTEVFLYLDKNRNDEMNENIREAVKQNIAHALKKKDQEKNQENQNGDNNENKDQNEKKDPNNKKGEKGQSKEKKKGDKNKSQDQKQQGDQGDQKDNKDKQDQDGDKQNQKNKKDDQKNKNEKGQKKPDDLKDQQDKKDQQGAGDKDKDKDKKDKKKEEKKDKDSDGEGTPKPKSLEEKENDIKKKRRMKKIPAALKQLLNDDRDLQRRYMKTATQKKDQQDQRKDW